MGYVSSDSLSVHLFNDFDLPLLGLTMEEHVGLLKRRPPWAHTSLRPVRRLGPGNLQKPGEAMRGLANQMSRWLDPPMMTPVSCRTDVLGIFSARWPGR